MSKNKFLALGASIFLAASIAFFTAKANGTCCQTSASCDVEAGTCNGVPCETSSSCCPIEGCPLCK